MEDRGRKIMCHICKEKFYKDELIQVSKSKRICQKCNDTEQAEINQRKELIDFICKGFGLSAPTGQQLRSIKEFRELGYSYFEIHYTLYYIYCVLKKNPEGTSLGLVPFYYEKAKEHHRLVENARRTAKNIEEKEVVIERNINIFKPNIKNTRLINMEEIF